MEENSWCHSEYLPLSMPSSSNNDEYLYTHFHGHLVPQWWVYHPIITPIQSQHHASEYTYPYNSKYLFFFTPIQWPPIPFHSILVLQWWVPTPFTPNNDEYLPLSLPIMMSTYPFHSLQWWVPIPFHSSLVQQWRVPTPSSPDTSQHLPLSTALWPYNDEGLLVVGFQPGGKVVQTSLNIAGVNDGQWGGGGEVVHRQRFCVLANK